MILGPETPIPKSRCPSCGEKLDGTFEVGGEGKPEPGSVSLCIMCGNWMIFDSDLKLAKPSPTILAAIKKDRRCQISYHAIMKIIRNRAGRN